MGECLGPTREGLDCGGRQGRQEDRSRSSGAGVREQDTGVWGQVRARSAGDAEAGGGEGGTRR